jgi:dTDP-4-amino-4,6-dideoxygalactose transaminase
VEIPYNRPHATGKEIEYLRQAIERAHLAGDGPFTKTVHRWLVEHLGVGAALMTHSCTGALEMMALLLDIKPGDEVIMPSFTFVSTANAFVLRGGIPVFVDVRSDTLNLDETLVEAAITPRTRAIMAVHYAGVACEMDRLQDIARRHGLALLEDAAQGIGSFYKDRPLGSIGALAAVSFHETKNVVSGEGGALLINDLDLLERAEIIREKGTNRSKFFRGQIDKYNWVDVGSSYLPSEMIAAFLAAQLENADALLAERLRLWHLYDDRLRALEDTGFLRRPIVPDYARHNGHIYYVLFNDGATRDRVLAELRAQGVGAVFHYIPLHSSPAGLRYSRTGSTMAITDDVPERLLRLPLFPDLGDGLVDLICTALEGTARG